MGLHSVAIVLVLGYSMLHRIRERNIPGGGRVPNLLLFKVVRRCCMLGANPYSASQSISLYPRLPCPWRRLGEHTASHALLTSPTPRAAVPQQGALFPRPAPTMAAASCHNQASRGTVEGLGLTQCCGWRFRAPGLGNLLFGVFCFLYLFGFTFTDVNHHAGCGLSSCVKFVFLSCGGKQQKRRALSLETSCSTHILIDYWFLNL